MNPSAAFFCLCMVVVYSAGEKLTKTKRDVSGLYPFPRVGKGDVSWSSQIIEPREMKRQGLIPFPRVGRNRVAEDSGKKRDLSENGGGMWFGPRLGRLQKRNYFNEDGKWALVQIREPSKSEASPTTQPGWPPPMLCWRDHLMEVHKTLSGVYLRSLN